MPDTPIRKSRRVWNLAITYTTPGGAGERLLVFRAPVTRSAAAVVYESVSGDLHHNRDWVITWNEDGEHMRLRASAITGVALHKQVRT